MKRVNSLFVLLLSVLFLVFSGCDAASDDDADASPTLVPRWTHEFPFATESAPQAPPVETPDGKVITSGDETLSAFDVRKGTLTWTSDALDPAFIVRSEQLLVDGNALFASHIDQFFALNLDDGTTLWRFEETADRELFALGFIDVSPTVVFGFDRKGDILLIDRTTGRLQQTWAFEAPAYSATYVDGFAYVGTAFVPEETPGQSNGHLVKIDVSTGDVVWTYRTNRGGFYEMRPIVEDGVVYAGTSGGDAGLFAVDAGTGVEIWRNEDAFTYAAAHDDDHIYVNDSVNLQAIEKKTGKTVWKTNLQAGAGESKVAVLDGYVYHPHGAGLFILNAQTGVIEHVVEPPDGSFFWEVGVGEDAVFAQTSSLLIAYEPFTPPGS